MRLLPLRTRLGQVVAGCGAAAASDTTTYDDTSEGAPSITLYSTADLTIGGTGELTVTGSSNNAIVGKDGLVITGGTIDVTSVDDGIKGVEVLVSGTIDVAESNEAMEGSLIIIDDSASTDGQPGGEMQADDSPALHVNAAMMVAPSTDSTQGWIATALDSTVNDVATAGSQVVVTDAGGMGGGPMGG